MIITKVNKRKQNRKYSTIESCLHEKYFSKLLQQTFTKSEGLFIIPQKYDTSEIYLDSCTIVKSSVRQSEIARLLIIKES